MNAVGYIVLLALALVGATMGVSIMTYNNTKPTPAPTPKPASGLLGGSSSDYSDNDILLSERGCLENASYTLYLSNVSVGDEMFPKTRTAYCSYFAHAASYEYYSYNSAKDECYVSPRSPVLNTYACGQEHQYKVTKSDADLCQPTYASADYRTDYLGCFPNTTDTITLSDVSDCTACVQYAYTSNVAYYAWEYNRNTCTFSPVAPSKAHCADDERWGNTYYYQRSIDLYTSPPTPAPTPAPTPLPTVFTGCSNSVENTPCIDDSYCPGNGCTCQSVSGQSVCRTD